MAASLRAGRELGPDYDDAVAAALAERIETTIDERIRHRLAEERDRPSAPAGNDEAWKNPRLVMGLAAMVFAIPLSAIAAGHMGPAGLILAWAGVILLYLLAVVGVRR